ncbi:MAG: formylglycine-generating enzyme family protein [Burkholderiales bacterium]
MALGFAWCGHAAAGADYRTVSSGTFISALSLDGARLPLHIAAFAMRATPVTVADYRTFVRAHPEWRRDRVPELYAVGGYLASWSGPLRRGPAIDPQRPVTEVSWFAARAYCASEDARLPTWYEWEYAAAADASRIDARDDPARDARILQALLARTQRAPAAVGEAGADLYGLHDMNALVWEWVDDYTAMFVNADARDPGQASLLKLCGGSALAFENRAAYPIMMRVAALSAMKPVDASGNIGFRCVRDLTRGETP